MAATTPAMSLWQAFSQFRQTVPVQKCCAVMELGWRSLTVPLLLTVGIALLDAALLLALVPLLSVLAGNAPPDLVVALAPEWERSHYFGALVLWLLGAGLGKAGLSYALHVFSGDLYQRSSSELANHLFGRYLKFGKGYFQTHSQGELWALLDNRHDLLQLFLGLQRVVLNSTLLLTHLLILLLISWPLTLTMLVLLPVLHLFLQWKTKRSSAAGEELSQEATELYPEAHSVFSVMDLYRNYSKEEEALERFRQTNEKIRAVSVRTWNLEGSVERAREVLSLFILVGLLLLTSFLVEEQPSQMILYLVFFFVVKNSLPLIGTFQQVAILFAEKLPGAQRFGETFGDEEKYLVPEGEITFRGLTQALEIRNLDFSYADHEVLHSVSFTLKAGTTTALVGPSGVGKSTIVELLTRQYDVPAESIFLDGHDIREFTHGSLRLEMAVVGQEALLFRGTLRENLLFGCRESIADDTIFDVLERARLEAWAKQLPDGLDTKVGDRGLTLSAGQRQRVSIARALLRDVSIYLLDEATSALDSKTEKEVYESLAELFRDKTVLVIAHRLETIRAAEQIVVLDNGRVAAVGSFAELKADAGLFRELWEAQVVT